MVAINEDDIQPCTEAYGLIVVHSGRFNSNSIVYLSSNFFSGFLNNILFVWPLFGLSLKSILPKTPPWGVHQRVWVTRESTVIDYDYAIRTDSNMFKIFAKYKL